MSNADLVIPGLWLGNHRAAHDVRFLKENAIDVIVNCTPDIPFACDIVNEANLHHLEYFRIPVSDSRQETDIVLMEQYLRVVVPYLVQQHQTFGKNVLVHCHAGKQRSAIVVAAYLFHIHGHGERDDPFDVILSKRPQAFTYGLRINFMNSFKRFFRLS